MILSEFDGLIKQIKQAALDAVNSAGPAGFYEGTVLSVSPLKVKVDQKLILGKEQLVLARNVTNHEMSVDVDWEYEKGTKKIVIHNALKTGDKVILADTCQGVYLDKRCMERGITRQPATHAIVQGTFKPTDLDLSGLRFNCGDYNYTVKEPIGNGVYEMVCETAGSLPNGISGQLIPIDYINGLETAEITAILIPGENEESDEDLRSRYFDTLVSQAYGGNITDYKQKTNAIEGVGGVKVTPIWNGGGTVKLTIIASDYTVPTITLIGKVQKEIDSVAPIGHIVTVDGAAKKEIQIETNIVYQTGWSWKTSGNYIEKAIDAYFQELAKNWASSDQLIVRISQIETRILDCAGVIDISNTKINGNAENLILESNFIPVRGSVTDGA